MGQPLPLLLYGLTFLSQIDPRCQSTVQNVTLSTKSVLCVETTPNWIITASDDKMLRVIDRKTMTEINQTIKFTVCKFPPTYDTGQSSNTH